MKRFYLRTGIFLLIMLPFFILGSFYDFEITYRLSAIQVSNGSYRYTPPMWVIPVEIFSEIPAMLLFAVSAILVSNYIKRCLDTIKLWKYVRWGMNAASLFSIFRLGQTLTMGIMNEYNLAFGWYFGIGLITIVIFIVLNLWFGKVETDRLRALFYVALLTICAGIVIFGVIGGIKYIWGRPRLRNLIEEGSMQGYLPWYKPMILSGYTSFPSGHSAKAGYVFLLEVWFEKKAEVRRNVNIILGISAVIICVARLFQAEHYLTDITIGMFITYVVVEFFKYLFYSGKFMKTVRKWEIHSLTED